MFHICLSRILLFTVLLVTCYAQNSTSSAQSASHKVGWQADPTERGTLALVWSCLATIITCTWSILHLNIPAPNERAWTKRFRKLKWMCITILFPEFIFAKAFCELKDAIDDTYAMKRREQGLAWEVEIGFACKRFHRAFHLFDREKLPTTLAVADNSGAAEMLPVPRESEPIAPMKPEAILQGVEMQETQEVAGTDEERLSGTYPPENRRWGPLRTREKPKPSDVWSHEWIKWTLAHSYFANMGGFQEYLGPDEGEASFLPITTSVMLIRCLGVMSNSNIFPSKCEIEDKGKADLLVKLLAVSQISWLVLSVVVRGLTRLPVSQLEVATVAFSVISVGTYVSNLWKPKDIDAPVKLRIHGTPVLAGRLRYDSGCLDVGVEEEARLEVISFFKALVEPSTRRLQLRTQPTRISNDTFRLRGFVPLISIVTAVSTLIFGGLHCIAWSFDFPSQVEVIIWRAASIVSATIPCIALLRNVFLARLINMRYQTFRQSLTTHL
jgi:hypothetical protein